MRQTKIRCWRTSRISVGKKRKQHPTSANREAVGRLEGYWVVWVPGPGKVRIPIVMLEDAVWRSQKMKAGGDVGPRQGGLWKSCSRNGLGNSLENYFHASKNIFTLMPWNIHSPPLLQTALGWGEAKSRARTGTDTCYQNDAKDFQHWFHKTPWLQETLSSLVFTFLGALDQFRGKRTPWPTFPNNFSVQENELNKHTNLC